MLAIASHLHKRGLTTNTEHYKVMAKLQKKYCLTASSYGSDSLALEKKQK